MGFILHYEIFALLPDLERYQDSRKYCENRDIYFER